MDDRKALKIQCDYLDPLIAEPAFTSTPFYFANWMIAAEAASGISIGKKCPASGNIHTLLLASFAGGTTLSSAPNKIKVGTST